MLQLDRLNREAARRLSSEGRSVFRTAEGLERSADAWIARIRAERREIAGRAGGLERAAEWLDRTLRTDAVEHLDDPDFSDAVKQRIVGGLHLMNTATLTYRRILRTMQPFLNEATRRRGGPARVLELASGSGGFALSLAEAARKQRIDVEIVGSDITPALVDSARAQARVRGLPVAFHVLDATDMASVEPRAYDVVCIAQSMHHFSPGKLARMMAESRRVATTAFVGLDGFRSLGMLLFVTGTAALALSPAILHDSLISARKFYSQPELELIARLAVPSARVSAERAAINSILTVRFDADAP